MKYFLFHAKNSFCLTDNRKNCLNYGVSAIQNATPQYHQDITHNNN